MTQSLYHTLPSNTRKKAFFIANDAEICYTGDAGFTYSSSRGEVETVESILMLLVAVEANIIGYLVCKWLDQHGKF